MPSTYTLISSNVLSSSAASITFSAIPSTYTDLVVRWSARSDTTNNLMKISFNSDSATNYSDVMLLVFSGSPASASNSNGNYLTGASGMDTTAETASTFSSTELYIPSYTASQNKPMSYTTAREDNSSTVYLRAHAHLWRNTAAITSIALAPNTGNLVSGSSFYLYGIKNS